MGKPAKQKAKEFDLWCEFEELGDDFDPDNDFSDVLVTFRDGRRYLLKVWTYRYVQTAAEEEGAAYLLPPDLLVPRLERSTVESALKQIVARDEIDFSHDIAPLSTPPDLETQSDMLEGKPD